MNLKVKNYSKKIKDKLVLDDINLNLKSGNVYGFFGRNGFWKDNAF